MTESKKNSARWRVIVLLLAALAVIALLAAGFVYVLGGLFFIGGKAVPVGSDKVDLSSCGITDTSALLELRSPSVIDLRGNTVSPEQIDELQCAYPGCDILWDVPLGRKAFDCSTHGVLELGATGVTAGELTERLGYFTSINTVELPDSPFEMSEQAALKAAFPDIVFDWNVRLGGVIWSGDSGTLCFAGKDISAAELAAAGGLFTALDTLDVSGCGFTLDELNELREAYGEAFVSSDFTMYGAAFSTGDTELDLNRRSITDTAELEKAVTVMPYLTKVYMSGCGLSNESMAALNDKYEDVSFVWTVYFGSYALRTDATYFCASNMPSTNYVAQKLTSAQLEPLKYCTELTALDLGHMPVTDLSFLAGMTHMKYLILADEDFTDISVLGTLKELYFVELFMNDMTDLTPLLGCPELRYLNVGYSFCFDTSVLSQLTQLTRLWYPGNFLSAQEMSDITAALPDTECYLPNWDTDGSTGGGWREIDAYYEMRDAMGMFYQPGGTGMKN